MSYQTPTAANYSDAILLDEKINEIREAMDTVSWITYAFGRAYKGIDEVNGQRMVFPEVYQSAGDYLNCMPNDHYNFSFIWVRQPQAVGDQETGSARGTYQMTANLSVIVFYDRRSIGTTITRPFDEELKYDCMYALNNVYDLEVTNVYDDIEDAYADFTRIEAQYLNRNFNALRFDVTVKYSNNCKITNSY